MRLQLRDISTHLKTMLTTVQFIHSSNNHKWNHGSKRSLRACKVVVWPGSQQRVISKGHWIKVADAKETFTIQVIYTLQLHSPLSSSYFKSFQTSFTTIISFSIFLFQTSIFFFFFFTFIFTILLCLFEIFSKFLATYHFSFHSPQLEYNQTLSECSLLFMVRKSV